MKFQFFGVTCHTGMFNCPYNKKLPSPAVKMLMAGVVLSVYLFGESRTDRLSAAAANSNEPPVLMFPLDTTFYEDTQLELSHAFILEAVQDPDHHDSLLTIQIRADSGLVFYRFDQTNQSHYFWANKDVDSCGYFHIRVKDPQDTTLIESFIVDIIPVNDAPVLAVLPDTCSPQDTVFFLPLAGSWSDVDNDSAEMEWGASAAFCDLRLSSGNDTLICSPPIGFTGWDTVVIALFDPAGLSCRDTFQIYFRDAIPPSFTFGIFQNPVASSYLDIYFFPNETLDSLYTATINDDTMETDLLLTINPAPYHIHYKMPGGGNYQLSVTASDTSQNSGTSVYDFAASYVSKEIGGILCSADSVVQFQFPANSIQGDAYLLCLPVETTGRSGLPDNIYGGYSVSAPMPELIQPGKIIVIAPNGGTALCISRQVTSGWEALPTHYDAEKSCYWAFIDKLGIFLFTPASPESPGSIPSRFALAQNHPNPFNAETVITFDLPETPYNTRNEASIRVYDLCGRKVATVLNRYLPAGQYRLTWSSGDLASGIYFYTLKYGSRTITKKMTVLK